MSQRLISASYLLALLTTLACTTHPPEGGGSATNPTGGDSTATSGAVDPGTTAAPTTTTASETSTSGPVCNFLDCSTTGADAPGCDIWLEDCPDGQKCMPFADDGSNAWNDLKCVPIDPEPDAPGDACVAHGGPVSGLDSCGKHAMCWNVSLATGEGTCVAMCTGTPEAPLCGSGQTCVIANDGVLAICLPQCDPLAQDCPYSDDHCLPSPLDPKDFVCILDGEGRSGPLGPCEYALACDPGLYCGDPSHAVECDPMASGCCLPFCDVDDPNTCPGQGQECIPWYNDPSDAAPFNTDVGACALP